MKSHLIKHHEVHGLLPLFQVSQLRPGQTHLLLDHRVVWLDVQQSSVVVDCLLEVAHVHVRLKSVSPPYMHQLAFQRTRAKKTFHNLLHT